MSFETSHEKVDLFATASAVLSPLGSVWCRRPRASLDLSDPGKGSASRLTAAPARKRGSQALHSKQSPQQSFKLPSASKISDSLVSALRERLTEQAQQDGHVQNSEQLMAPTQQSGRSAAEPGQLHHTNKRPFSQQQQQQRRHLKVDKENLSQDPLHGIDCETAEAYELLTRYSDLAKIGFLDSALKVVQAAVEADRKDVLGRCAWIPCFGLALLKSHSKCICWFR